eukprot:6212080-Pleurochrysis_carterae.AAC.1
MAYDANAARTSSFDQPPLDPEDASNSCDSESVHSDGEDNWPSGSDAEHFEREAGVANAGEADSSCDDCDEIPARRKGPPKPWTKAQFPHGVKGFKNFDMSALLAAAEWECPCTDCRNCLSIDRITTEDLYKHRFNWQQSAPRKGGKRDAMRAALEDHYSSDTLSFSRSFVVGSKNDVCHTAFGLACGLSIQTFQQSITDCRKKRPMHRGRCDTRDKLQSQQRRHLEAYIRMIRGSMEGDKGGQSHGHWYTSGRSVTMRWQDYRAFRLARSLPIIGSEALFKKLWGEHKEIKQYTAKSHPKCDVCGLIESKRDALGESNDEEAVAERKRLVEAQAKHDIEHRTEREYADNFFFRGETYPQQVTAVNIDAPTQWQFDIPTQRRCDRDPVKSLDTARKWQSKVTGAQVSGFGFMCYVARVAIGSGPNLVLTVLMLVLDLTAK